MRICYVGNYAPPYSTENDVRLAFEDEGHEVIALQENSVKYSEIRRQALQSGLLLWTGTWDTQPLDESITTFKYCADRGIPTATYHLDTWWSVSRGGRRWWTEAQFHTGTLFTADGDYAEKWRAFGKHVVWLPAAVRHTVVRDAQYNMFQSRPEFECDVAMVGSDGRGYHEDEWPYRRELVDQLIVMCRRHGWIFRNPGGRSAKVPRENMGSFYASAKVTVGDSLCLKQEKSKYWSDRVYEATGRRGLLIMPQIDALENQFGGNIPMYSWGDWAGLENTISYLLNDPIERAQIANDCYNETAANHTYRNRVRTLLETLGL